MVGGRRLTAAAVAAAAALSVGCTRIEADIEVRPDGMVEVDASYWLPREADGYPDPCVWFHRQAIPGLEVVQLSQGWSRRGCRAVGTTSIAALESRHLMARQQDGSWEFTFRPQTRRWPASTPEGLDARVRDFDVAVRFPGRVVSADASATVDGTTVRWTRASAMMEGLTASARDEGSVEDSAPLVLGLVAALGAGALGGWLLARRPGAAVPGATVDGGPDAAGDDDPPTVGEDEEDDVIPDEVFFARPAEPEDPSVWAPRPGDR